MEGNFLGYWWKVTFLAIDGGKLSYVSIGGKMTEANGRNILEIEKDVGS